MFSPIHDIESEKMSSSFLIFMYELSGKDEDVFIKIS